MDEYDINDFISVLCLRNMLITKSSKELVEFYSDFNDYLKFINTVIILTNIDSGFLLLSDNFQQKVNDVIQIHRYDDDLDDELYQTINDIIVYLNNLNRMSNNLKKMYIKNYIGYNEDIRSIRYENLQHLYNSLLYDAITVITLNTGNTSLVVDKGNFLISLNYLMTTIPELFEDEKIQENVNKIFSEIESREKKENRIFKKYLKFTRNNYSRTILKEE